MQKLHFMKRGLLFILLLLTCGIASAQEKHKAQSAYDFMQSIGVNSAIYRRGESVERTIECINYIGARWIRTDESMNTDEQVAAIKLASMGVTIDALTDEQIAYMNQVD